MLALLLDNEADLHTLSARVEAVYGSVWRRYAAALSLCERFGDHAAQDAYSATLGGYADAPLAFVVPLGGNPPTRSMLIEALANRALEAERVALWNAAHAAQVPEVRAAIRVAHRLLTAADDRGADCYRYAVGVALGLRTCDDESCPVHGIGSDCECEPDLDPVLPSMGWWRNPEIGDA